MADRRFPLLDTFRVEAEELECRLLEWRRLRQQREVLLFGEWHAHGIARHGAEMVDEAVEAVDGLAIGIALDRLLGFRGW